MNTRLLLLLGFSFLMVQNLSAQSSDVEKPWKDVSKEGFYEMATDQVDSLVVDHFYKRKFNGALLIVASLFVPTFGNIQINEEPLFPGAVALSSALSTGLFVGGIVIMTQNRRKILYQHLTGEVPLTEEKLIKILKDRYEEENGE